MNNQAFIELAEWCRRYNIEIQSMDNQVTFQISGKSIEDKLQFLYTKTFNRYTSTLRYFADVQIGEVKEQKA
jgi:hypothetical protein